MALKTVIYRFDGDPAKDEVVLDASDKIAVPSEGSIITRKGSSWKVFRVEQTDSVVMISLLAR
jgi:hypothetical protein